MLISCFHQLNKFIHTGSFVIIWTYVFSPKFFEINTAQSISAGTRAENWWHFSTQKPPNVGSSSAISEPIIAGLVSARGLPNPMKLGNQLHRPTQTG